MHAHADCMCHRCVSQMCRQHVNAIWCMMVRDATAPAPEVLWTRCGTPDVTTPDIGFSKNFSATMAACHCFSKLKGLWYEATELETRLWAKRLGGAVGRSWAPGVLASPSCLGPEARGAVPKGDQASDFAKHF